MWFQDKTKKKLQDHIKLEHVCKEAMKIFNEQEHLNCDKCPYVSTNQATFLRHLSSVHGKYCCIKCGFQTMEKSDLKDHNNTVHKGGKHQCQNCLQAFNSKSSLKAHTALDHGYNFRCILCNHKTFSSSSLTNHYNTIHKCEIKT